MYKERLANSYYIYGLSVALPLEMATGLESARLRATMRVEPGNEGLDNTKGGIRWYHRWEKPDGRFWLAAGRRADGLYALRFEDADFAVSADSKVIYYDRFVEHLTTQHYLLNQVIPMVMNLRGTEVLHASCVWTPGGAVAFIGNGGYGKSTLAASLMGNGFPLISDDAVPLLPCGQRIWTSAGPPEMGLWPRARRLLHPIDEKDASPHKLQVSLAGGQHCSGDFPLRSIYFLKPSGRTASVEIAPVPAAEALAELVRASHRLDLTDSRMLRRQFDTLYRVACAVPAKALVYPMGMPEPSRVSGAILTEIERGFSRKRYAVPGKGEQEWGTHDTRALAL